MDLKDKVISLGLAEQLKELKIEQKSLFYWEYLDERAYGLKYMIHTVCPRNEGNIKHFSAFTSDELMDLLPSFVDTKKGEPYNIFYLEVHKRLPKNIQYCVKYICDTQGIDKYGSLAKVTFINRNIYDENLSNALAKMLILLIEENLYVKREPIDTGEIL